MTKRKQTDSTVRIIGGTLRSRQIRFSESDGLRPTADRIRETLFNWLQQDIEQAVCLDLFAGSGALGFEAASRGAARVDLVESQPAVVRKLRENIESLQLSQSANVAVHTQTASTWLQAQTGGDIKYDLVFLDPPYNDRCLPEISKLLASSHLLQDRALIYLENNSAVAADALPDNWQCLKSKKAGQVYYYLYQANGRTNSDT